MDAASPTPFLQQKTSFKLFLNTVWSEFILKLKEYWNSGLFIPHVYISRSELSIPKSLSEFCSIDLNTSILYQKLQLLQACILVKWKRGGYGAVDRYQSILNERLEAEKIAALKDETIRRKSSVAEFGKRIFGLHSGRSLEGIIENAGKIILDASNELEQIQDGAIEIAAEYGNIQQIGLNALLSQRNSWTSDKSWEKIHSTDDSELFIDISDQVFIPERDSDNKIIGAGRLEQSGKLSDGSPLYIPETQDHGYMTIEMITKQQEIFENLGVSSEAAQERAKMQSVQLLSDMEAFKAANPTSQLLDFVQWHSPRDIILVDGNPSLSTRMEDPHNIWNRLWNRVIGIPSRSQTSLFDYESHANETFNELENLDVISNLLPTFLLIAYHVLVTHPTLINIPVLKTHVKEIGTLLSNHNWDSQSDLINIVNLINSVEKKIGIAISMLQKVYLFNIVSGRI